MFKIIAVALFAVLCLLSLLAIGGLIYLRWRHRFQTGFFIRKLSTFDGVLLEDPAAKDGWAIFSDRNVIYVGHPGYTTLRSGAQAMARHFDEGKQVYVTFGPVPHWLSGIAAHLKGHFPKAEIRGVSSIETI